MRYSKDSISRQAHSELIYGGIVLKTFRWGMIGLGAIANAFAEEALESVQNPPYAVAARSLERAQEFAKRHHAQKAYGSYEELFADPDVDMVYIATPNSFHYTYAKAALLAGKHVLCEKAIVPSVKELDELLSIAKERNLILAEAMTIYHMPIYRKVKEFLESGALGKVKAVQVSFCTDLPKEDDNRFYAQALGGGAMLDIGTYALSFVRSFLPTADAALEASVVPTHTGVDREVGISLKNGDGQLATVILSIALSMPTYGIVGCEKGYLLFHNFPRCDFAIAHFNADRHEERIEAGERPKALLYEKEDFERLVREGTPDPAMTMTHDVVRLIEETLKRVPK